jgi:hypothetical protein
MSRRTSDRSIPALGDGTARQPRRWGRRATAAAASITTALAITGAASAWALAATSPGLSWHFVKHVHSGGNGDFTAVVAVGKTGGWAFNGVSKPAAWKRSGGSWTQVSFPGRSGEEVVAAGASSASNVWAFTGGGSGSRALRWNGSGWSAVRSFAGQIGGAAVISKTDVWVFGEPVFPGSGMGTWHYNGRAWAKVSSGHGLEGGSALSASSIWAFDGTKVAHWNGRTWTRTSVASLLPPKTELNDPAVVGIDAQSKNSVYAVGSGNLEDEGGPTVILHYNGHSWAKVAQGSFGVGTSPLQQVASDRALLPRPLRRGPAHRGRAADRAQEDQRRVDRAHPGHGAAAGWGLHARVRQPGCKRRRRAAAVPARLRLGGWPTRNARCSVRSCGRAPASSRG